MSIKELIKEIANIKDDIVFTGSVSFNFHLKSDKKIKDIDIVVNDLNGLEKLGELKEWETHSPLSYSGKRAFIKRNDFDIDIFIEETLPEYILIDGIKYETIDAKAKHYKNVIESTRDMFFIHYAHRKLSEL